MNRTRDVQLAIIGGGPAGMAAALVAGRASITTVVINAESPRNAVTAAAHGLLTRDGEHPLELLAIAKKQLGKYGSVEYRVGRVSTVDQTPPGFVLHDSDGLGWRAERVIIATGYRDELTRLGLPGIEDVYGRSAYPCPFCDGFEHRGERVAAFVRGLDAPIIEHYVAMVQQLCSPQVTAFVNPGDLDAATRRRLEANGAMVVEVSVSKVVSDGRGQLTGVALADGRVIARDVAFIAETFSVPATPFATQLGVPTIRNPVGWTVLDVGEQGQTPVDNLYVVGDARSQFGGLTAAAAQGAACASRLMRDVAMAQRKAAP
ncbi:MAG: FAD-dependent oxidoreductase [Nannocystaceae bacterium]|nr:FAD-dependent oxidoreductase [Nannocystaceae bacterium]